MKVWSLILYLFTEVYVLIPQTSLICTTEKYVYFCMWWCCRVFRMKAFCQLKWTSTVILCSWN